MKQIIFFSFFILSSGIMYSQNYDESKVPSYTLPDVLKSSKNKQINSTADWEKIRRPELLQLFEDNVYGQLPKTFDSIRFKIVKDQKRTMNGKSRLKQVQVSVWRNSKQVFLNLVLFTPSAIKKPVPVFLLINNRAPDRTDPSRVVKAEFWPAEMLIDSGYAIAAFHVADAAPDNNEHYREGVMQLYPEQANAANGMKTIGCWAWAASRIMDYFETDKDIDAKKVFIVGHSRGGKTALWAGAQDKRFAMVFANCSGTGGASLARRQYGETVKIINTNFPYWFCDNYKKFNDDVNALPVDQHMLVSLIAPRPLYTTNASKDLWADPTGSFLSLKNAEKVYALYELQPALPAAPPRIGDAVINSTMGYHITEGIHDLTVFDWTNFLRFANYHLRRK